MNLPTESGVTLKEKLSISGTENIPSCQTHHDLTCMLPVPSLHPRLILTNVELKWRMWKASPTYIDTSDGEEFSDIDLKVNVNAIMQSIILVTTVKKNSYNVIIL